ncbi:hypothetical protein ACLFMI_11970 [Pseudonocardia nantongensis]|uniref:hypothetical protein n=1 Tax=Pseudonocardia nantongensis TaxID=1181885 RepID=UPI00397ADC4E
MVHAPRRQLVELGVGVDDTDDIARIAARLERFGTARDFDAGALTATEPVSVLEAELGVVGDGLGDVRDTHRHPGEPVHAHLRPPFRPGCGARVGDEGLAHLAEALDPADQLLAGLQEPLRAAPDTDRHAHRALSAGCFPNSRRH